MKTNKHRYYFLLAEGFDITDIGYLEVARLLARMTGLDPDDIELSYHQNGLAAKLARELTPDELAKIVSLSGYVKYAGRILLMDNWERISEEALYKRINWFDREKDTCIRLIAFTREGFPERWPYDSSGILASRFYRQKFFLGEQPITIVLKKIRSGAAPWDRLNIEVIESAGEIRSAENDGSVLKKSDVDCRTLMLFQDIQPVNSDSSSLQISLSGDYTGRNDKHLMVLIESSISINNIIHHFDDNKPYWPERVTTPPRLMAAAMNLMELPCGTDRSDPESFPVLMDPFVGTGTTIFEGLKYPVKQAMNDFQESVGLKDNLYFFCNRAPEFIDQVIYSVQHYLIDSRNPFLRLMCEILSRFYGGNYLFEERISLTELVDLLIKGGPIQFASHDFFDPSTGFKNEKMYLKNWLEEVRGYLDSEDIDPRVVRMLIYITFRVVKDRYVDVTDSANFINSALLKNEIGNFWSESSSVLSESGRLMEMLQVFKEEMVNAKPGRYESFPEIRTINKGYRTGILYSPYGDHPEDRVAVFNENMTLGHWDKTFPKFNFLITDIPYSFNSRIDDVDRLYDSFVELINRKGKPNAEMVVIALDKVKSGQKVPDECFADHLIDRIIKKSKRLGRCIEEKGKCYWKSNKALNRMIIHFKIH